MARVVKIVCLLIVAVGLLWFSVGIRGGKAFFKVGAFERPILISEASNDDTGTADSNETEFA